MDWVSFASAVVGLVWAAIALGRWFANRRLAGTSDGSASVGGQMPEWADPLFNFGGVLVGAAVAWWGMRTQAQSLREQREANESRERRQKGAALVGLTQGLLVDAEPERLVLTEDSRIGEVVVELWGRWEKLRDETLVYAADHPSERVGDIARELLSVVPKAISNAHWASVKHGAPEVAAATYKASRVANSRAKNVAERLRAVIRGEEEPHAKTEEELRAELDASSDE